jgi:DNA replication protein DnaC
MDFLYWIADQRYENRDTQGTIITTNLNAQSMREIMGDAFTSRVASGICIRHDGPDRRADKF